MFYATLGLLSFSILAKKKWKQKWCVVLLIVSIILFAAAAIWKLVIVPHYSNQPTNPEVINAVTSFNWKDKDKLSSLGIVPSKEDEKIYVYQSAEDEYEFTFNLSFGNKNDMTDIDKELWNVQGDRAYKCSGHIELNWFLYPEMVSTYYFIIEDITIFVHEHNPGQLSSDFDRFVLEKLK